MAYNAKLDWEFDDDITEHDVNRWEKGIDDTSRLVTLHDAAIQTLQIDVKTMKDALFNNLNNNIFSGNFSTLNDVVLTDGWYDETGKRLVV
ncbi:hypothetical protein [Brevibacillus daliensis]|uniref:hypothetical protein n=1 Tax=Brevibacillus daliensis TaxID=2892995 RepID=UPI001E2ECBA1|nr:hypothetical protein [Brevibacillus daliensis]